MLINHLHHVYMKFIERLTCGVLIKCLVKVNCLERAVTLGWGNVSSPVRPLPRPE